MMDAYFAYIELLRVDAQQLTNLARDQLAQQKHLLHDHELPIVLRAAFKLLGRQTTNNTEEQAVLQNLSTLIQNVKTVNHEALLTAYNHGFYELLLQRVTPETLNKALRYKICNNRSPQTIKILLSQGANRRYKPTEPKRYFCRSGIVGFLRELFEPGVI